jgi:hypothetical protein
VLYGHRVSSNSAIKINEVIGKIVHVKKMHGDYLNCLILISFHFIPLYNY